MLTLGLEKYLRKKRNNFEEIIHYLNTERLDEVNKIGLCGSMVPIECLKIKLKDQEELDFLEICGYLDELVAFPTPPHMVAILDLVASVVSQKILIATRI